MSLGSILKATRQAQNKSQKQLANGICSQSMLSAIENNRYTPNAKLMLALCQRLKIDLNQFSLAANFAISDQDPINTTISELCNQHQYQALKVFLQQPQTLAAITTDTQTQAYYYYLGIAEFQTEATLTNAHQDLKMAVNLIAPLQPLTALSRLCLVSLALILVRNKQHHAVADLVKRALTGIRAAPFEEDLNVVFYLAALIQFDLNDEQAATDYLRAGIEFAAGHDSHYMLANDYRLLAEIAAVNGQRHEQLMDLEHQQFLVSLFHEKVNEHF
ncbi:helix-turn-helix domain-containing protein [Lapidilactobacillus wuchangensis]|uniref:helix-turn-helix domain-containing protein n=1 Tax=Lapidilactobacillus wuchangensis TaxID=2486001 RepID=UPI000F7BAC0F|nr:helix-turn-helix transcriptional regulator [Lapidilactobacillus wuchangensis]